MADVVKHRRCLAMASLLLGFALVLVGTGAAWAHIEFVPTLINRYVTLSVRGERLHLQFALLYGNVPALDERRRIDGDGDGQLSAPEINQARRRLARSAAELLSLRLDDQPLGLSPVATVNTGGKDAVAATPLQLELEAVVALPPGTRRLDVALGRDLPPMGETEIVLEPGRQWQVVGSESTSGPTGAPELRFTFPGARRSADESRQVTFLLRHEAGGQRAGAGERRALGIGIAILVLAALVLAGWRLRAARAGGD